MKKYISFTIALLMFPTISFAAFMNTSGNEFYLNESKEINSILISSDTNSEITSEYGINIVIENDPEVLWDEIFILTATGSAVDNGKISSVIEPEYINNYKVVHIPIISDFAQDEEVLISGLRMRIYDKAVNKQSLILDLDGDYLPETYDLFYYWVSDEITKTDNTPPFPAQNFQYVIADDNSSVTLTWGDPPDYDFAGYTLKRYTTRDGKTQGIFVFENWGSTEYIDTDVQEGDIITYELYTLDSRNSTMTTLDVEVIAEEIPVESPVEEPVEEPVEQDKLADELSRLYNYYQIRYSIKCMPSGVAVPENDSACLWARIDLIYAQGVLGESDVDVSLTDHDLYLMELRLKYPEARYQTNCVEADEPASNCSALGKAIDRVHYFVD